MKIRKETLDIMIKKLTDPEIAMRHGLWPDEIKAWAEGKYDECSICVKLRRPLIRWGDILMLVFEKDDIAINNLIPKAWSYSEEERITEAEYAIRHFFYEEMDVHEYECIAVSIPY